MKSFDHLKHTGNEDLDPRIFIACINSHDYRDALRVLAGQGCQLATIDVTESTCTGLEAQDTVTVELQALLYIGEYMAFCGGADAMPKTLERVTQAVQELMKRN